MTDPRPIKAQSAEICQYLIWHSRIHSHKNGGREYWNMYHGAYQFPIEEEAKPQPMGAYFAANYAPIESN